MKQKHLRTPWYIRVGNRLWWTGRSWSAQSAFAKGYSADEAADIVATRWKNGVRMPVDNAAARQSLSRGKEVKPRYEHAVLVPHTPDASVDGHGGHDD